MKLPNTLEFQASDPMRQIPGVRCGYRSNTNDCHKDRKNEIFGVCARENTESQKTRKCLLAL